MSQNSKCGGTYIGINPYSEIVKMDVDVCAEEEPVLGRIEA
jgi:hypothetical protein